jgi:lipopolysaccharide biosynthesis regulator YciM
MDLVTLVFIVLFLAIIGVLIRFLFFTGKHKASSHDLEIKALNYMLKGEKEQALKLLKEIGHQDTSNLGVYLQVGDLNRQLGNADAAVRVHQDVLSRHNISQDITMMAHERLAKDYEALGQYEKAAKHAEAMLKEDKKNLWALQSLHRFAVKSKNWNSAIKAFQKENASGGSADPLLPAIYKTQEAIDAKNAGNVDEAITLLKQASKLNNKCAAPYYHLGKIKQEENNYKHAIDFFTTFVELDPTAGSYVFSEIEKMYFELGQFEQVEQFYQRLHKKQPENLEVIIGLAAYFERKGEYRDALSLLEDVKDPDFTNLSYILKRLNILEKLGHKDALKQAADEFVSSDRRSRILTCPECGDVSDEPSYICGKCGWVELV